MKAFTFFRSRSRLSFIGLVAALIIPLLAIFLFTIEQSATGEAAAGGDGTPNYLPLLAQQATPTFTPTLTPTNTPTPTATPAIPAVVTELTLPNAQCPNDVGANPVSGYVYIANHDSSNVSVINGTSLVGRVNTGEWPTDIASDPDSNRSFVTNLHGGTSVFEQGNLVTTLYTNPPPLYGEPHAVAYNPVNDYLYTANILGSVVQVFDGTTSLANIPLTAGWILDVAVDTDTGTVYVPSWEIGKMFVINDTQIVSSFQLGWGPAATVVDPETGYVYTAHTSPNTTYPHNLSVFMRGTQTVTPISTGANSRSIALDPLSGYVYATNPDNNTVTVLQGPNVVANIYVGGRPWDVAVHPETGYVFVTNLSSNLVTVLKNAAIVTTLPVGEDPISVGVDTVNDYVYVANENSEVECNEVNQCWKICNPPSVTILR